MNKWIVFALLILVLVFQYDMLRRIKSLPARGEVFARIEESSSAVRQLEERITGSMAAEQEANARLRRKVEELEQKLAVFAAATPTPAPTATPKPARSR